MLTNYLKIALRNLLRHRSYSIISISGLGLGLACCLAIFLFVQDELRYDTYHSKKDRIYRLVTSVQDASYQGIAKVNGPWGITASNELPEVEAMTRFVFARQTLFEKGDQRFYENDGFYTDSTVFDIFDYSILQGNAKTALLRPDGIVLTETLARKYFGKEDAIGNTLKLDNDKEVIVTAVIKDVPLNSHFTFTFLLPMSGYNHPQKESWTQWNQYYTYLLLRNNADPKLVANKFKDLLFVHLDKETAASYTPFLQPLTSIHLYSDLFREMNANSDVSYIYIFSAIGLLILIISSINFINLTTARAMTRLKEVGIRKSSGAIRSQLITQYLSESILISSCALVLALVLLWVFLPSFNLLLDKHLSIDLTHNLLFTGSMLFITLFVGLLSGSYPAFYLARLKPSEVLKGKTKTSSRQMLRQVLVVAQFSISIFLVVSAVIIFRQLTFIQGKKLGFNPSELITIPIQDDVLREKNELIKNELVSNPAIISASISGGQPGGNDWGIPCVPEGVDPDNVPPIRILAVDHNFIKTFEMELATGRDFSVENAGDSSAYIINEEAAKELGWEDPLTKSISMPAVGRPAGPVIGVLKDFHFRSLKEKIGPVLLFIPPASWAGLYTVRIKSNQMDEGLIAVEKIFSKFDPGHPFSYSFFDEKYGQLYTFEKRLAKLVGYFTFIGIFIACMGLFSLAAFMTEQRTKEIGIRKVMGASVKSITVMLTRDLISLVLVGFVIAAPIGYYAMQQWLGDFAYRVTISPLIFIITGIGTLILAWTTVSYKVLKAGLTNPVDSLRVE